MSGFRRRWLGVALAICAAWACSGEDRVFVDVEASGGSGASGGTTAGNSDGNGGTGLRAGNGSGAASGSGGGAGESGEGGSPSGAGGSGAMGGSSNRGGSSGNAGEAGDAGDAGSGGEGGTVVVPPPPGRPGTSLVSGGVWMKSANFQLFSTMGQNAFPTSASSENFRLHGGIVGTTQP